MGKSQVLAGVPWAQALAKSETGAEPLNLLFVTVDGMNSDSPGWIGESAQVDAESRRVYRYSQSQGQQPRVAPIGQPSREAMMTGLIPHRSGGLGFTPVHEGTPTLTTLLQKAAYFAADWCSTFVFFGRVVGWRSRDAAG